MLLDALTSLAAHESVHACELVQGTNAYLLQKE